MINNKYARAYTEVLELIKYFPQEEYCKIVATIIYVVNMVRQKIITNKLNKQLHNN